MKKILALLLIALCLGLCAAAGNTPQEMADILADGAVRRALPGRRRDDVTVAVLRLDKTP